MTIRNTSDPEDVEKTLDDVDLEQVRDEIKKVDQQIVTLLGTRLELAEKAGEIKHRSDEHDVLSHEQTELVVERSSKLAEEHDIDDNLVQAVFRIFVHMGMEEQ